jgi:hypothetical protein
MEREREGQEETSSAANTKRDKPAHIREFGVSFRDPGNVWMWNVEWHTAHQGLDD